MPCASDSPKRIPWPPGPPNRSRSRPHPYLWLRARSGPSRTHLAADHTHTCVRARDLVLWVDVPEPGVPCVTRVDRGPVSPPGGHLSCSRRSWSPIAARSPSEPSAPPPSWVPRRWRSSLMRTASPNIGSRRTSPTRSARRATRSAPTWTTTTSCASRWSAVRTRSTRATASCRRTRCSPRPALPTASPSSGRRPRCCT